MLSQLKTSSLLNNQHERPNRVYKPFYKQDMYNLFVIKRAITCLNTKITCSAPVARHAPDPTLFPNGYGLRTNVLTPKRVGSGAKLRRGRKLTTLASPKLLTGIQNTHVPKCY